MSHQAAWVPKAGARLEVGPAETYTPNEGEVLLRNKAVAINPVDGKIIANGARFVKQYPAILGSDVAGIVEAVGAGVTKVKAGDRIIGHAVGLVFGAPRNSGFQDFTVLPEQEVSKIPDFLSFEEGSVIPLALDTSLVALFPENRLALPLPGSGKTPKSVFVYGASSSVGSMGVQLAKAAGSYVVATASAANAQYVRDLGADQVFDYNSPSAVEDIVAAIKQSNQEFAGVWDTIGLDSASEFNVTVLGKLGGGKLYSVLAISIPLPDNIKGEGVFGIALPGMVGHEQSVFIWNEWLAGALAESIIKPRPQPKVVGKGLEAVQTALDEYQKGVSATKLVVSL